MPSAKTDGKKEICMFLSDKQLARIPIAPRAKAMRPLTKPVVFLVAKDPAVMAIARMVIAGLDKKYHIHPDYRALLKIYGKEKTRELIEGAVAIPGTCDIIQTNMCYGGIGLFGGLAKNSSRFTFYEWTDGSFGLLSVSMTRPRSSRYRFRQKTDYRLQSKKVSR